MTLEELERESRARQLRFDLDAAILAAEEQIIHDEAIEEFKQRVIDWMIATGSGLGDALAKAGDLWQKDEQNEKQQACQEEEREALREAAKREAEERGQHYLAILKEHPILREMLAVLAIYAEDRERFEADLDAADEFAAGVEAGLGAKLEGARRDADSYARAGDNLQRDLYAERDAHAETRRKCKRRDR